MYFNAGCIYNTTTGGWTTSWEITRGRAWCSRRLYLIRRGTRWIKREWESWGLVWGRCSLYWWYVIALSLATGRRSWTLGTLLCGRTGRIRSGMEAGRLCWSHLTLPACTWRSWTSSTWGWWMSVTRSKRWTLASLTPWNHCHVQWELVWPEQLYKTSTKSYGASWTGPTLAVSDESSRAL